MQKTVSRKNYVHCFITHEFVYNYKVCLWQAPTVIGLNAFGGFLMCQALVLIVFISILLLVYFRPRTLWDTLGLEDMKSNGVTYCTFSDIFQTNTENCSGTVSELLAKSNELFGLLLHEVSISGPVFYINSVINPDIVNLYLSLPKEDGTYQKSTVEIQYIK